MSHIRRGKTQKNLAQRFYLQLIFSGTPTWISPGILLEIPLPILPKILSAILHRMLKGFFPENH